MIQYPQGPFFKFHVFQNCGCENRMLFFKPIIGKQSGFSGNYFTIWGCLGCIFKSVSEHKLLTYAKRKQYRNIVFRPHMPFQISHRFLFACKISCVQSNFQQIRQMGLFFFINYPLSTTLLAHLCMAISYLLLNLQHENLHFRVLVIHGFSFTYYLP